MNTNKYFKLAKNASEFSDCNIKVGAILVYKKKVISVGWNTNKSNPIQKHYNVYRNSDNRKFDVDKHINGVHAEMMCIMNAKKCFKGDFSKCSIFVYSKTKNNKTRLARPCAACMKALEDNNIYNIYYTNNENGFNYERRY